MSSNRFTDVKWNGQPCCTSRHITKKQIKRGFSACPGLLLRQSSRFRASNQKHTVQQSLGSVHAKKTPQSSALYQMFWHFCPHRAPPALQRWCPIGWKAWWTPSRHWLPHSSSWWLWTRMVTARTRSSRGSPLHKCPGTTWTHMVSIGWRYESAAASAPSSAAQGHMLETPTPYIICGFGPALRNVVWTLCLHMSFHSFFSPTSMLS